MTCLVYSVYLFYWYKGTSTDLRGAAWQAPPAALTPPMTYADVCSRMLTDADGC
jgi:hypothetical protein